MSIDELEACAKILFELARTRGIETIDPSSGDGYWTVSAPAWRQLYEDPPLSVGSFSDDEEELKKMLTEPARASSVDIDRVAHLMRLLSDQLAF